MDLSLSTTNEMGIRNVIHLMDGAIRCGELELLLNDLSRVERRIQRTKKAYWNALRAAGRLSFGARQVSAFESRSIRLEQIICELQRRYDTGKAAPNEVLEKATAKEMNLMTG